MDNFKQAKEIVRLYHSPNESLPLNSKQIIGSIEYLLQRLKEAEMALLDVNLYYGDGRNIIKNYFTRFEKDESK